MFYKTRIQSVSNGSVVDVNGRRLTFIGWLPVKAGDTVFTDGKVIFGNAPPKGSPAIFDEPGGIPVLGDKDSDDNELRGYFNKQGKYKKYSIKGDEWIVNSDKIFKHDNDEDNIIDAEISDDGKLYTVVKKIVPISEPDESEDFIFRYNGYFVTNEYIWRDFDIPDYTFSMIDTGRKSQKLNFSIQAEDADFVNRDSEVLKSCELIISKDNKEAYRININDFIKDLETELKESVYMGELSFKYFTPEQHQKAHARLHNFKVFADGTWVALIGAEFWAEHSFFYYGGSYTIAVASSAVYKNLLLKIYSDKPTEKVAEYAKFYPLWIREYEIITNTELKPTPQFPTNTFPYQRIIGIGSFLRTVPAGMSVEEYVKIYGINNVAGEIFAVFDDNGNYTIYGSWGVYTIWDSRFLPNAPDYDNPTTEIVDEFNFPVQDDFQAKIKSIGEEIDMWQFGGVFDKDDKKVIGEIFPDKTDAHKWNMSLAELKGGQYLFGIHKDEEQEIDGVLYKIDKDGNSEQVGEGLKNFRLRELKKISKAKR